MKVTAQQVGAEDLLRDLAAAPEKIRVNWAKRAATRGALAVELVKRAYRTTGTEPRVWGPSTWRRSGQLERSYHFTVKRGSGDVTLEFGAIRPTKDGQVPIQARVMEGIDAQGNKVSQFIIRARNKPWLVFPLRRGGGLSKSSIIGWVRTKSVVLKPRPALDSVGKDLLKVLEQEGASVVLDAL